MNIVRKAILQTCWQEENEHGMHAARPWLRWFLSRVVGVEHVPARESETKKRRGSNGLQSAKTRDARSIPRPLKCTGNTGKYSTRTGCMTSLTRSTASGATTSPVRLGATCGFRFTTCRTPWAIAYGQGSGPPFVSDAAADSLKGKTVRRRTALAGPCRVRRRRGMVSGPLAAITPILPRRHMAHTARRPLGMVAPVAA
jgi:hypothetical protein